MTYPANLYAVLCTLSMLLILSIQTAAASSAQTQTYEAPLPAQLSSAPDLCALVPCREVIPGADSFSERKGNPSYVEAYTMDANGRSLAGYVFLSSDIVDIPGYSGKPIVTLIGMDTKGRITGVKILRHGESILHIGIPEEELSKFVSQYVGKFVGDKIDIGKSHEAQGVIGLDAISGATVTSIAENQVILRSGIEIARQVGIIKATVREQAVFADIKEHLTWDELIRERSIQRMTISHADVGSVGSGDYIDIYFGYLNAPVIGRSVLGDGGYDSLMSQLKQGEHAIFIIANGAERFKGSGFVRGGIYERIKVVQGMDTFTFRDLDYLNLYEIKAEHAPGYGESGIFIIRNGSFSSAYPWSLVFLANKIDKATGERTFTSFEKEYWLPARYMVGGHPIVALREPESPKAGYGLTTWVVIFAVLIAVMAWIFVLRYRRRSTRRVH